MTGDAIRKMALKIALLLILAVVVVCTGYVMIVLNWSYAKGERIGYVQKFSEKGWLCKTWEGELAMVILPGTLPEIFNLSVRDEAVAHQVERLVGQRVSLTYEQHKGVPGPCFGDTEYFIVRISSVT